MKTDNDLERSIKDLRYVSDAESRGRILDHVLRQREWSDKGGSFVRKMTSAAAIAAGILVAILIATHFFGSIDGATLAWADVVREVGTFRPYSYVETVESKNRPSVRRRMLIFDPSRRCEEFADGSVHLFDLSANPGRMLGIYPDRKVAILRTFPCSGKGGNFDALRFVTAMTGTADASGIQELGVKDVDGRRAKTFFHSDAHNKITVWVDLKTRLPIRMEIIHPDLDQRLTMTEFAYDIPFDSQGFNFAPPPGYSFEKIREATEKDLVDGLRAIAVYLGGEFPPVLEPDFGRMRTALTAAVQAKHLTPSDEARKALIDKWQMMSAYLARIRSAPKLFKFTYVGKGVKLGDAKTPVLMYYPDRPDRCHIIYGDLSVKIVEGTAPSATTRPVKKPAGENKGLRP